jgi:arginine-tRNA-protein transferase
VRDFEARRGQRRILQRNRDLLVIRSDSIQDDEAYELYHSYIVSRHADGDMYPPDREQYESFLNAVWDCTEYYRFYERGRLVAVTVIDALDSGLSAIYTFFDPEEERRSLGVFAVLWQIQLALEVGLEHVYLGYWIKNCKKMSYKSDYRPLEVYVNSRWTTLV